VKISSFLRRLPRDRPRLGLAVGGLFLALASVLRWMLGGISEGFGPMTFLPAILLAGLFGGIRIGLALALVCTAVAWVMFFPPYGSLELATPHVITMIIFMLTAALELYVIRRLRLAIAALSESRERSNILFRELQHRVANNLQLVAAVLQVHRKKLDRESAGAQALKAAQNRLELMSRVHRRLHDPASVDHSVEHYLEDLCTDLIMASDTPGVHLVVRAQPIVLDLETLMSVSMIVAELVTNSLKHAFQGRSDGRIEIDFESAKGEHKLTVADDGPGPPPASAKAKSGSLGQGILKSLASQLHGTIEYRQGPGAIAHLVFRP
jgi:two-component sensor histidine kinase